jgi:hypothetical protein
MQQAKRFAGEGVVYAPIPMAKPLALNPSQSPGRIGDGDDISGELVE